MGLDINLNTSKIDISEDDGLNVDLYKDNIDISDDEADDIIIEITGLKSINKFIGLEDTPLYYDNGKFFKVEDNKIIYTDIQWKDISGDLEDAPEIIDLIKELVEKINEEVIHDYIDKHNNSQLAHPYIRNIIEDNYTTLNNKIDNIETEITQDISELENALNTEIENRENADNGLSDRIDGLDEDIQEETLARVENDTTLQNNINSVVSDLSDEINARESADTTLSNNISDLSDGLIQEITDRQTTDTGLQSQITSNYNTLDGKIDNVESSLSNNINDLSDTVDANDTAINNKVDNINNTLTNSISTLSDTVSSNYTTLDNKIDSVNGALADSITALDNKYDSITSGLDDKIDDVDDTLTTHISDNSNPHNVTKTQVGLSNVDNTSDLDKPISTATQTALDGKVPNTRTVNNKPLSNDITLDYSDVNALPDTTTINDLTTTAQQNALNSGIDSTLTQQITTNQNNISNLLSTVSSNYTTLDNRITSEVNTLNGSISDEETARINADNGLQSQIDAITSASDVTDIVGTYAELQAYDTTGLPDKSIIKVLQDESRNDETTYYRWVITNGIGVWVLIGEEGPYYTKSEADGRFVNQATTVNNKALSSNITLTASDVGALPDNTVIGDGTLTIQKNGTTIDTFTANTTSNKTINITVPTDTQDLTNGAGYITNSALNGYATESFVLNQGYITGITSTDVTTALGYVPYNSTNPSGYTTNVGTVTSVNNTQPDANGNVTLVIPDSATWGNITGTLSNQTDLQTALNSKYDASNPDGYITSADLPTNYVTTDTAQDISGRKTFLGEKAIYFKQSANSDKLGFTLYNPSSTELGALEWRPNTINGNALLALNCPQSGSNYVGFRYWSNINIIAPRPTTNGNYFIPVNITDGTNTVTANNNGTLNISTLLPNITVDQTYDATSANAQSGVAISGAGFIKNTATGSDAITILGNASNKTNAINIGVGSTGTGNGVVAIGKYASASQSEAIALGYGASASAYSAIQLGMGTNSTAYTFSVGLGNNNNYQLLDGTTGLIPDARISSNIQRTLVSGTNIKTINNESILGSGDISINADNIFWATYGTTTYTDIMTAINDGKLVLCTYNGNTYYYIGLGNNEVSFVTNTVGTNYMIHVDSSDNWTNDSRAIPTFISDLTDNTSSYPIDKARSVVDQNSGSVKMWTGTKAQYDAIVTKDANTLYNITDDNTADAYEAYTKSEVDTLLNSKASTDLANVTDTGKILMSGMGMPSNIYDELTLGATGSTYTAPADGWVAWNWWTTATSTSYMHLANNTTGVAILLVPNQEAAYQQRCYIPVAKGDTFGVGYANLEAASGSHSKYFIFIYAQGSESEAL